MNKTAIALGTFDGLHTGHIEVLKKALEFGAQSVAVTFATPPKAYFDKSVKRIFSPCKKSEILKKMGFSEVVFLDFAEIKDMSPESFLKKLKAEFNPAFISCGFNYRFGKNGAGDAELLKSFCEQNKIELSVSSAVTDNNETVSSSLLRNLLECGEIERVNRLCAEPFGFSAAVIHGDARGRTIGFPTVNQIYPEDLQSVRFGVYKSEITVGGKTYGGITNIGVRPTFQTDRITAETYIIGFSCDVYGEIADLRLLKFIRPEKKFSGIEELKNQIEEDIKY